MPDLRTQLADLILSTAVWQGREGEGVTSADRDSEEYLHCQEAAERILHLMDEEGLGGDLLPPRRRRHPNTRLTFPEHELDAGDSVCSIVAQ